MSEPSTSSHEKREEKSEILTPVEPAPKSKPGQSWKAAEVHEIPHNNLKVVFPGLMLTVFLAALDQTIIAISLPAILDDLGGIKTGYAWVGTAYLLLACSFAPFYGKISDLVGRKPVLYSSIAIFLFGSAMCGAAQSFIWLVVSRGVQGVGGGGIFQLVTITISDITPLETRGKYTGFLGAVWGFASVLGPLVGGLLTDKVSWRWIFWINLPCGGFAAVLLIFFLKLNPVQQKTLRQHIDEFDFLGLLLIMAGVVLLLLGFTEGETSWSSRNTIIYITIGGALLVAGAVNEALTKRSPIIPPRLFKTRTTAGLLASVFWHAFVYFGVTYYCPVYFQVLGSSATKAGALMIPFSFGGALTATVSGLVIVKMGAYRPVIWFGWVTMLLGQGLLILFDEKTSKAMQEGLLLLLAVGVGCLFQPPLIAVQAAMPLKDMATATSTFGLIRQIGGTIGISVGGAIYASEVNRRTNGAGLAHIQDVRSISRIEPLEERLAIQHHYTKSLSMIWVVWTPLVFVGLLCVLPIRAYTLKRQLVKTGKEGSSAEASAEPQTTPGSTADSITTDLETGQTVDDDHKSTSAHDDEKRSIRAGAGRDTGTRVSTVDDR